MAVAAGFLLILAGRVSAATYYVDYSAGVDTNNGTSTSTAWRHCPGDPAASGAAATTSLTAGDTVNFKGGVTYLLTGATGIQLSASGTATSPIRFDGNSAGVWGTGRARISDNYGGNHIAAFSASSAVSFLTFANLQFDGIGGANALPADTGFPATGRFGAGLVFNGGVSDTTVTNCVFHDLGYAFNQKPMNAPAINGVGISATSCSNLSVTACDFSRVGAAIELAKASAVTGLSVTSCTFHDNVCWTIDLPPGVTGATVAGCTEINNDQFAPATWTGYGPSPRTTFVPALAGATVTLRAAAATTSAVTFQWSKDGSAISGATDATLILASVDTTAAGTYTVVARNAVGTTTSNDAVLNVTVPPPPAAIVATPAITTQPANVSVAWAGTATFTVAASGAPTFQWYKGTTAITGATSASLTLTNVSTTDAATYSVTASNSAGSVTSANASLTLTTYPPVIVTNPAWATANVGASARFTVVAKAAPSATYQWQKNGVDIPGATGTIYTLPVVSTSDAAKYDVVVTNALGSVMSKIVMLKVVVPTSIEAPTTTTDSTAPASSAADTTTPAAPAARLANLSVRAPAGSGDATLILGFVVRGSSPKSLLLRGVGPALTQYGVPHALTDPVLSLYSGSTLLDHNANWTALTNASSVAATAQAVGGFALPAAGGDTALLPTIAAGTYTAQLTSAGAHGGTGLVELYDADASSDSSLANVSVRTDLSPAESPILGFAVTGTGTKRLLIRAVGPTLTNYGVTSVNADPQLAVYSGSTQVASNDNWGGSAALADTFTSVGAFPLKSADSRDAALVFEAAPGTYSVIVSGVGGTPGVVVVELYELP